MSQTLQYDEVIESNGIKIPFVPHIITPKIERPMRNNRYEKGECELLRAILRPGDRVLEFGAGVGLISSVAALVDGVEAVTAIEANPDLIPVIRETHALNNVKTVDLRNGVIVASDRKRAPFYLRADFWASSMEPESRAYEKKKHLPCYSIHALITETRPSVIICDIEGGEMGLFDEADLSQVRAMVVEFHPKVYGADIVESITKGIQDKGLIFQVPDKPSSVRCFVRDKNAPKPATINPAQPDQAKIAKPQNPNLAHLTDKPWKDKSANVLITTCMKDEGPFILEWLAWHKSIGIDNYVIFTNDCTDGTDLLLDRLDQMGELRHLPNPALATKATAFQQYVLAYTPHLSEFKRADLYISMDVDEFINIRIGAGHMDDLLAKTGPFDALSISELNHGSNNMEAFEPGLMTEQFPGHQRETPGPAKSRRGVKTIVRLGDKLEYIRNHRPDLRHDAGAVTWLDGSGNPLESLHRDANENGLDVRGTYDYLVLDHFPLRSLNSYLVKMYRGDVVVANKMVSQRYWRMRNRNYEPTSGFSRQQSGFRKKLAALMQDKVLAQLHKDCCAAHQARIEVLLQEPEFQVRKQWIFDNAWDAGNA
ncbi:MAG: FkbM family methyltransferase [Rhodobacteraceae bacterium]|nr:FkbM family methyltransferase [Paracoccaceae bacterium]